MPGDVVVLKDEPPNAKRIYLHAFLGDRKPAFVFAFKLRLKTSKETGEQGPNDAECLVFTGHVGISFEGLKPIFGFNPSTGEDPAWRVFARLTDRQSRHPYPGKITDDTEAFDMAAAQGLEIVRIEYVCSEELFDRIKSKFEKEKSKTDLYYSFPDGGGDCNCATWPIRGGYSCSTDWRRDKWRDERICASHEELAQGHLPRHHAGVVRTS